MPKAKAAARLLKHCVCSAPTQKQNTPSAQEANACKSCKSNIDTLVLQASSDKELHLLLGSHAESTSFAWPDSVKEFKIATTAVEALFPNQQIPSPIVNNSLFMTDAVVTSVNLRILTVPHDSSVLLMMLQSTKGAKIEKGHPFDPKTVLSKPGDGTTGLASLQSKSGAKEDSQ